MPVARVELDLIDWCNSGQGSNTCHSMHSLNANASFAIHVVHL